MLGFQEQGFLSTVDCSLHVPAEYLHMAWMNVMPSRLRVLFNRRVIVASVNCQACALPPGVPRPFALPNVYKRT